MMVLFSDNNLISGNTFLDNRYGLSFVWSKRNKIYRNDFINNEWDAFFVYGCFVSDDELYYGFSNHWNGNYWDEYKGFGPKVIHGKIQIQNAPAVPWVQFDWHPAKEP
jgi:parallel beta-helix repeat protein